MRLDVTNSDTKLSRQFMEDNVKQALKRSSVPDASGDASPMEPRPPGPMRPLNAIIPPPPPVTDKQASEKSSDEADDDGVTRRVWANAILPGAKTSGDRTPPAPFIYKEYAQRQKQGAGQSAQRPSAPSDPSQEGLPSPFQTPRGTRRTEE